MRVFSPPSFSQGLQSGMCEQYTHTHTYTQHNFIEKGDKSFFSLQTFSYFPIHPLSQLAFGVSLYVRVQCWVCVQVAIHSELVEAMLQRHSIICKILRYNLTFDDRKQLVNRKFFLAFFGHLLILGLSKKKEGGIKFGDSAHDIPAILFWAATPYCFRDN